MTNKHTTNTNKKSLKGHLRQGQKQASELNFYSYYSMNSNPLYSRDPGGRQWQTK